MSNCTRTQVFGVALASALALSSVAATEPQEGRPRGMGPVGYGSPMRMLRELDLSEDQREQVKALLQEVDATGLPQRLRETRESLHDAIESGADEATLRQKAAELGEVEGDAAVEFARIRARVQEILTPEQKKELEQLKAQARERMEMHRRHREERRDRSKSGADLL